MVLAAQGIFDSTHTHCLSLSLHTQLHHGEGVLGEDSYKLFKMHLIGTVPS